MFREAEEEGEAMQDVEVQDTRTGMKIGTQIQDLPQNYANPARDRYGPHDHPARHGPEASWRKMNYIAFGSPKS